MKKAIASLCLLGFLAASCGSAGNNPRDSETDTTATTATGHNTVDEHTTQNSLDWHGVYEGTLPCADCPGIKTVIELKQDGTYSQSTEYIDRKDATFREQGKIEWHANGNDITLIPEKGEKHSYKVREGSIVMLNADGEINNGTLAEHYVLMKK